MADVATLGLEVRSDQVEKGTRALDQLTNSAKRAQAAANGVSATTKNAGAAAAAANSNWETYEETVARLGIKTKNTTVAATAATTAVKAQSAAVQVAGQRAEIATRGYSAFASVLGLVGGLVGRFAMNALSTAVGVLIAELAKLVDWGNLAAGALNWIADALVAVAPYAVGAAAALTLIYAPAILSGIGAVTLALGAMSFAAIRAAASFTVAWLAAIGPAGWFILGLSAVVTAAIIFRDELTRIFGFDIVGAAKTGINTIIAVFHGGYEGIVAAWDMLPAAFADIGAKAGYLFADKLREWINEAILLVGSFIKTVNEKFGTTIGRPTLLAPLQPQTSSGAAANVGQIISDAISKRQGTDYLGDFGSAVTNAASAAADKIRQLAGSLTGVKDAAGGAGEAMKRAANDNVDAWAGLREVTEQQSAELTRVGQSAGGIIKGLIDGTLSWKDALGQALQVAMQLFQSMNGGKGLFGDGLVGGLLGGMLGFASGGFTGNGAASHVAGVVHGGEYVFSKRATDRIGVGALEQLHNTAKGYASGGHVTPAMPRVHSPANVGGNITIEGSTVMIQGGADKQTAAEFKRMMDERDRRMMRDLPKMVDGRMDARQMRRTRA